jgi:tetratricopeptide (TPR) repeat protein
MRLAGALDSAVDRRALLLGQLYLERDLFGLAEVQFAAVSAASPQALPAAAYAAYTVWRAGDKAGGLDRLRALAEAYPDEPRARALLAIAALDSESPEVAREQLVLVSALAPGDPATQLAWGQWYVAQRDYVTAATAFTRALALAPLDQRGVYALYLARFRIATGLELCEQGLPVAVEATQLRPNDVAAWLALTQARSTCADRAGALAAAERALALAPHSPEALYRYGRALASAGQRDAARAVLVRAADADPASTWRVRAEEQVAQL